jgi:hypothetical protein
MRGFLVTGAVAKALSSSKRALISASRTATSVAECCYFACFVLAGGGICCHRLSARRHGKVSSSCARTDAGQATVAATDAISASAQPASRCIAYGSSCCHQTCQGNQNYGDPATCLSAANTRQATYRTLTSQVLWAAAAALWVTSFTTDQIHPERNCTLV